MSAKLVVGWHFEIESFNGVYNLVDNEINRLSYQQIRVRHRPNPILGQTGLSNKINSCLVNVIMQCLFNTKGFVNLFETKAIARHLNNVNMGTSRGALSACLSAYSNCYWSSQFSFLNTNPLLDIVSMFVHAKYDGGSEQDSHQFLILLLIKLASDTSRGYEELTTNLMNYPNANLIENGLDYLTKQRNISSPSCQTFSIMFCAQYQSA